MDPSGAPTVIDDTPPGISPARERAWQRAVTAFAAVFGLGLVAAFVLILVFDPYDSGRFPTFMPKGVSDETPRTANVSRGRDPAFNAVIIGNSYVQLLDPARLSASTGLQFVQMTIPGTGSREQAVLLRWFLKHHAQVGAVVIGADYFWCTENPELPLRNPFPFWLYGRSVDFLLNSLHSRAFALMRRRILIALHRMPPTDPAGYSDYELGHAWNFKPEMTDWPFVDLSPRNAPQDNGASRAFPALDLLDRVIAELPANTPVILVIPPQFRGALPDPDSRAAKEIASCKAEILRRIADRSNIVLVDFLHDTPAARKPENFMDHDHYRANVAREIEQQISSEVTARTVRPPNNGSR